MHDHIINLKHNSYYAYTGQGTEAIPSLPIFSVEETNTEQFVQADSPYLMETESSTEDSCTSEEECFTRYSEQGTMPKLRHGLV